MGKDNDPHWPWYTPRQAAKALGVSATSIYRWREAGKIEASWVTGYGTKQRYFFHSTDLDDFVQKLEKARHQ